MLAPEAAALFRAIDKWQPTLLIDEADTFMRQSDELRGVINSGHTRSTAYVLRCDGDTHEPVLYKTWGAKAVAGIGSQADTIMDRSIEISMRRRLPDEQVERFQMDRIDEFEPLRRQCARWAQDNGDLVRESDPELPEFLDNHTGDNWRTILNIASAAGPECQAEALKACMALCNKDASLDEPEGVLLLRDMQDCFGRSDTGRMLGQDLVDYLHGLEDRSWV